MFWPKFATSCVDTQEHSMEQQHSQPAKIDHASNDRLDALVTDGLLDAHFQPIVDLHQGQPTGFEALARPQKASGFAHPGELFDQASNAQRLWEIEGYARRTAFAASSDILPHQRLFINSSPIVFADPQFPVTMLKEVSNTPWLNPSQVVIEITERTEDHAPDQLLTHVKEMAAMGFQIAIDDVGAGTSGLNRIMLLRPHWLKLDRELVTGVDTDRVKQHLIRFIIQFSRLSGVDIIAEGIEHESEIETLAQLGVRYLQGFYLGRPQAKIELLADDHAKSFRRIWRHAEAHRYRAPDEDMAARFAKPVFTLLATDSLETAISLLEEQPSLLGIAVVDCDRLVGWCERSEIRSAYRTKTASRLCEITRSVATIEAQETTIADMFEIAACRPDIEARRPLIVVDSGRVIGQLSPADIITAAAESMGKSKTRSLSISGLPGRVQCDQHLHDQLMRQIHDNPHQREVLGHDVVFIDIRDFNSYNWTCGHELGDQLLEQMVVCLRSSTSHLSSSVFLGHMGNDRFLLTGPRGMLEAPLETFLEKFDRCAALLSRTEQTAHAPETLSTCKSAGARVLIIEDAFRRVSDCDEIFAIEERMHHGANGVGHARNGKISASQILVDRAETAQEDRDQVA